NIYAAIKPVVRHDGTREAAKPRGSKRARRDQHQPPMELRLLAPVNRQRKWHYKRGHVPQRNDEESISIGKTLMQHIKTCHSHGSRHTHNRNRYAQPRPEPAHFAMHAHVACAHQRGLKNKEQKPSSENRGIKIKDKWARRRRMKEILVDGMAESIRHHGGD